MSRILVIADDLTGAAEIGGIAVAHGLTARIALQLPLPADTAPVDVSIVDTNSRHLPAPTAAESIHHAARHLPLDAFQLVYKKTDSILRGPIAAELIALLQELHRNRAVLLAQNPSRDRTIVDGIYRIAGTPLDQTPLAADPEHPATTADALQLLDPTGIYLAQTCGIAHQLPSKGIILCDAQSPQEIAACAAGLDDRSLPAGGADFFRSLLDARFPNPLLPGHPDPPPSSDGATLIICGSACDSSRFHVDSLAAQRLPVCPFPVAEICNTPPAAAARARRQWTRFLQQQLAEHRLAIVAVREPRLPGHASAIRTAMAAAIVPLLRCTRSPSITRLLIEGGATAAAIAQRAGWKSLQLQHEIAPGIVALSPEPVATPLTVILKPGSYPWPAGMTSSVSPKS